MGTLVSMFNIHTMYCSWILFTLRMSFVLSKPREHASGRTESHSILFVRCQGGFLGIRLEFLCLWPKRLIGYLKRVLELKSCRSRIQQVQERKQACGKKENGSAPRKGDSLKCIDSRQAYIERPYISLPVKITRSQQLTCSI